MIGLALGNILSGLILHYIPGWEPVFYIYGAAGIVWWVFWCFLIYSTPDKHPFATEEEKVLIREQLKPKKVNITFIIFMHLVFIFMNLWQFCL